MFWANDLILAFGITTVAIAIVVSVACYVWSVTTKSSAHVVTNSDQIQFTAMRYSSDATHRVFSHEVPSGREPAGTTPKYLPLC
jgi:hypothetical protein